MLTAAVGALVWIFQEGHFGALGTPGATLVANMPVLMFCIVFGLSMDYEVFLVSDSGVLVGIRSRATRAKRRRGAPPRQSVALSVAHRSGISAAALVMSMSFAR